MLSYHADMDINTNPFELGLDRLVNLEGKQDFIGKTALKNIKENGVLRKQVGLVIEGQPLSGPNTRFWEIEYDQKNVGKVTSAIYSPRLKQNIALAMISADLTSIGTEVKIKTFAGTLEAKIVEKPFFDPKKLITSA